MVIQAEICNFKVVAAAQTTDIGGARNVGGNSNTHKNNQYHNGQPIIMRKYITTNNTAINTVTTQLILICRQHARKQNKSQEGSNTIQPGRGIVGEQ